MKKTKKPQKKSAKTTLTVLGLLGAISYWGTAARMLLVSTIVVFAYLLNITHLDSPSTRTIDSETMFMIFGLATLVIVDLGYVITARTLVLNKQIDRWVIMMTDLLLAGFFIAPSLVMLTVDANYLRVVAFVLALLVVSLRILLGLLFAKPRK